MPAENEAIKPEERTLVTKSSSVNEGVGPAPACLVVIYGEDLGRKITLGPEPMVLGRSAGCEVQFNQSSISRTHCRIHFDGEKYLISDMGSTNGTLVNDAEADQTILRSGDQLRLGRTILKFIAGGHIEAQYHEEIYRLMTCDGLTNLANKKHFEESVEREIERARRYERNFCISIFDVDRFKEVNDKHGHLAGDAVLRQIGAVISENTRANDLAGRIGGDEFGVILPETSLEQACRFGKKLVASARKHRFEFDGQDIPITISMGIAEFAAGMADSKELFALADRKLFIAKNEGRDRMCA